MVSIFLPPQSACCFCIARISPHLSFKVDPCAEEFRATLWHLQKGTPIFKSDTILEHLSGQQNTVSSSQFLPSGFFLIEKHNY